MARQELNIAMHGASGHIGKKLVFKNYNGRTVISKYPDMSGVIRTEKQAAENSLFRHAVAFAKAAKADHSIITDARFSVKKGQSFYHAALSWYLKHAKLDQTLLGDQ